MSPDRRFCVKRKRHEVRDMRVWRCTLRTPSTSYGLPIPDILLLGRLRLQLSVLHVKNFVSRLCNCGVVGDNDDTASFIVCQPLQDFDDIAAVFAVEVTSRLVGKDQLRTRRQRPRNGDALCRSYTPSMPRRY